LEEAERLFTNTEAEFFIEAAQLDRNGTLTQIGRAGVSSLTTCSKGFGYTRYEMGVDSPTISTISK
jgi:hypothetical protein